VSIFPMYNIAIHLIWIAWASVCNLL
jgi:hypothetical protein